MAEARYGPYILGPVLAAGGMGTVHRARHAETGLRVALKTVRPAAASHLEGLRREIAALARVRHPGVVRILEHGLRQGLPWFAMELVEGTPLRGLFGTLSPLGEGLTATWSTMAAGDTAPPVPAPAPAFDERGLDRALGVMHRLCHILGYLHGEGLVHRDLKPQNVLVTAAGEPVLVDFGLSTLFSGTLGREALAPTPAGAGTPAYMAPEQIRGADVDARADLYALGCMLYELVCGRPPFSGPATSVLAQHVGDPPVRPSDLVGPIPTELEALILSLLAKDPAARPGQALAVARSLEALGAAPAPQEWPSPKPYLYRPRLIGRSAELSALLGLVEGARLRGQAMLLVGESGIGKTRLLTEVFRRSRQEGAQVVAAACAPPEGPAHASAPLDPVRRLLAELVDRDPQGPLQGLVQRALRVLDAPDDAARLPFALARQQVLRALVGTVGELARAAPPLVLAIDDLQWADPLTMSFLELLLEALQGMPLALVLSARTELDAAQGVPRLHLSRLNEAQVRSVVRDMLALEACPEGLMAYLARHAGGNPLYVGAHLQGALDEGILDRNRAGQWRLDTSVQRVTEAFAALSMPQRVRELVGRRLARLSPAARRLAGLAALIGRPSPESVLRCAAPDGFAEALAELRARGLLVARQGLLTFVHDALREATAASLDLAERVIGSRCVAEAIEACGPESLRASLGPRWEEAGVAHRAHQAWLHSGLAAVASHALEAAERDLRGALRTATTRAERSLARLELAERVLAPLGRQPEAIELAEAVDAPAHTIRAHLLLASLYREVARTEEALRVGTMALAWSRAAGEEAAEAKALGQIASAHAALAQLDEAAEVYREGLALQTRLGDAFGAALSRAHLGVVHKKRGELGEARALTEASIDTLRTLGARRHEGLMLNNLGNILREAGDLEGARAAARTALDCLEAVGDQRSSAVVASNLAVMLQDLGEPDSAARLLRGALRLHRAAGNARSEAVTRANLGELHALQGRSARARACYAAALPVLVASGARRHEAEVWLDCARLERRLGGLDPDLVLARAEAIAEDLGALFIRALAACERGHLALREGRSAEAAIALAEQLVAQAGAKSGLAAAALDRLRRAQSAPPETLQAGEHPSDLPSAFLGRSAERHK